MLARRRPLTVKWIPNTATWNKSSESERERDRQRERAEAAEPAAAAKRAVNCTKHVADERVRTPSLMLSLSLSLSRSCSVCARVCVCGCEGSAAIVAAAAAAAQATSTPAARPSPVSRSVSFKSCHGQRCQPASVPFWLPSNVVVVRLKHASSTANNSSNIPQQQPQQRAKSILTSRETNKKDHVKIYI